MSWLKGTQVSLVRTNPWGMKQLLFRAGLPLSSIVIQGRDNPVFIQRTLRAAFSPPYSWEGIRTFLFQSLNLNHCRPGIPKALTIWLSFKLASNSFLTPNFMSQANPLCNLTHFWSLKLTGLFVIFLPMSAQDRSIPHLSSHEMYPLAS